MGDDEARLGRRARLERSLAFNERVMQSKYKILVNFFEPHHSFVDFIQTESSSLKYGKGGRYDEGMLPPFVDPLQD